MKVQVTLTVNEAKRIIAKGIVKLPYVRKAFRLGKIFLKGGTTVSAVCEELVGKPLLIAGRITPLGTKMAQVFSAKYHSALIDRGELLPVDDTMEETLLNLKSDDVAVIGANAIDSYGNAALMYGVAMGGKPAKVISGLMSEIQNIVIAAGLEKLIPGSVSDVIRSVGRRDVDMSLGMAVGLTPVIGNLITEKDAIELLGDVTCLVIGKGGISGAEGSTTMLISGKKQDVKKVYDLVISVKGTEVSGIAESLPECTSPHEKCSAHQGCIYKKGEAFRKSARKVTK